MRVVIGVNFFHPSIGGSEYVVQNIAERLSVVHDVFIVTRDLPNRKKENTPYQVIGYKSRNYSALKQQLQIIKPDIIFVYSDVFDFFGPLVADGDFRIVVALCGANYLYSHPEAINSFATSKSVHAVVCHSTFTPDYRLCMNKLLESRVHVIPNAIDLAEFDSNKTTKTQLNSSLADRMWILSVSNFFPGKGQDVLIDVLKKIPNHQDFACIQICSDTPHQIGQHMETEWLKRSKLEVKMPTVLLKNLQRHTIISYYKNSSIFALTSKKEVAPIVLLESMAASLPWVAANVGNTQDLIGGKIVRAAKMGDDSVVFTDSSITDFAENICAHSGSPMGDGGRRMIEKNFTWERVFPMYLSLLES